MRNALTPSIALLSKLGSIVAHVEEATTPGGHPFDVVTLRMLLSDPEVSEWMARMQTLALVPVKREAKP